MTARARLRSVLAAALGIPLGAVPCSAGGLLFNKESEDLGGVTPGFVYTGEAWGNVRGGLARGADYIDNFDLTLEIDGERALGWPGATFFFYGLANTGAEFTATRTGDAQTVSNIEAPRAVRVFEAWYEQALLHDLLSFKLGKFDLNSEFDANETGSLFLNSSHGIGVDFSQAGPNGPSIFPRTSLGARARVNVDSWFAIQAAAFDGDPAGAPGDFSGPAGALIVAEAQYAFPGGARIALGGWRFTGRFDDVFALDAAGNPVRRRGNEGVYALGEMPVLREEGSETEGLSAFLRVGIADRDVNQFGRYIGAGAVYTGLLPGRDADRIGVGVAAAGNSGPFKDSLRAEGREAPGGELNLELAYRYAAASWLAVQPDIQYIFDPGAGANGDLDDALAIGLRVELTLF